MPAIRSNDPHPRELPPHISGSTGVVPNGLVLGPEPSKRRCRLVPGSLPVGSILGRVAESGVMRLSEKGSDDGSEVPVGVLAVAAERASGRGALMWETGTFNSAFVVHHFSWSMQELAGVMRDRGISFQHRRMA